MKIDWTAVNRHNAEVAAARREHYLHPIEFAVDSLCETCQTRPRYRRNRKCKACMSRAERARKKAAAA